MLLEENWSDQAKLLSLQREQKQKQNLIDTLIKINDDIELIDYTLTSLINDGQVQENKAMISEMSEIASDLKKDISSLETTQLFKSK